VGQDTEEIREGIKGNRGQEEQRKQEDNIE
jgi:hypothetical protein